MLAQTYVVQPGDTLSALASKFGVSVSDISGYKSGDPNKIGVGENLNIGSAPIPAANSAPLSGLGSPAYTPPPVTTPTASEGLIGTSKSIQDSISALTPEVNQEAKDIQNTYQQLFSKEKERSNLYQSEGVNTAKQELDQINQTMQANEQAYIAKVDKIRNSNPTGRLEGGIDIELDRISKDHAIEQSANAITASVKLGNFTTAKSIVDQKVDAETEALKNRIDGMKYFFEKNSDSLTSLQKTQLQQKITEEERAYDEKKTVGKSIGDIQLNIASNGAPASVVYAVGKATSVPEALTAAGKYYDQLDRAYKGMQIQKIASDLSGASNGEDPANLLAYAQQYASTGTIPTGMPKGTFGIISQAAKELPKPAGTLVDRNTGVKPSSLSPTQEDGIIALKDLSQKLEEAQTLFSSLQKKGQTGISSAILGSLFPTQERQAYNNLKIEIVDVLARARTGAAITAYEETSYKKRLPGIANKSFLLGSTGKNKIQSLKNELEGKLNTILGAQGLAIYGYSPIVVPELGQTFKVGDIVQSENGKVARVNADGSLSTISQ